MLDFHGSYSFIFKTKWCSVYAHACDCVYMCVVVCTCVWLSVSECKYTYNQGGAATVRWFRRLLKILWEGSFPTTGSTQLLCCLLLSGRICFIHCSFSVLCPEMGSGESWLLPVLFNSKYVSGLRNGRVFRSKDAGTLLFLKLELVRLWDFMLLYFKVGCQWQSHFVAYWWSETGLEFRWGVEDYPSFQQ